jgi:uncharacterized protein (TIGR02246 family)
MGNPGESDIRAVLDTLVDAWNRGDAAAFGAVFDEAADYVTVTGSHSAGRSAGSWLITAFQNNRVQPVTGGRPAQRAQPPQ